MGNYYIGFKALFKKLNIDFSPPPPITKRTVELGAKFSPEFACLPFKINLGNLIEALDEGCDVLFQSGARGACRYGSYLDLQEEILKDLGFKFSMHRLFDTSGLFNSWRVLRRLNPKLTPLRVWEAIMIALAKIKTIDRFEDLLRRKSAYIENKKELIDLEKKYLEDIDRIEKIRGLRGLEREFEIKLKRMTQPNKNPVKVGIIGELYVVMEPQSNMELEKHLMEMGVELIRPLCLWGMVKEFLSFGFSKRYYLKIAKPYLEFDCCAHSNISVAEAILFAKDNIDGIIHVKPHACMPEVTAMSALYRVSKDYNIPILFLSFDEHTSSVGVKTRIEAFVELLKRRREARCTLV
jgi:predicted nucleotide-binding protein (sugar kinase/HSP70/actin superfamily)